MTWSKGQPWRVARSLDRLNEQIREAHPLAVPPATPAASWGSIADSAHSTSSDHYPHYYSALGSTAVVCARDFPHAPALGLDAHALAENLRLNRDPRIGYVISNGRITGPNHGWRWDPYDGSDPHDTHIHVSSVHAAAADDTRDWQIETGDDDMDAAQFVEILQDPAVQREMRRLAVSYTGGGIPAGMSVLGVWADTHATVKALGEAIARESSSPEEVRQLLAQLPAPPSAEDISAGVLAGLTPAAIAAAIPVALTQQVADELARRLAAEPTS